MLQVRLHRDQRDLRKHELGAAQLRRTSTAKRRPRESAEAGLERCAWSATPCFSAAGQSL